MQKFNMISLGAWCRPAYQIGCLAEKRTDVIGLKGPFDWTITSFTALKNCLKPGFDPNTVLGKREVKASFARSGMCDQSKVIFHHDIAPATLAGLGAFKPGQTIPDTRALKSIVRQTKGRFAHTFRALTTLQGDPGPILFVRWRRQGHPDPHYPQAFDGETPDALLAALDQFLGHDRFHVLSIQSEVIEVQQEPITDPITAFNTEGRYLSCSIRERKGWNGDQQNNFRGDEASWQAAFDRALSHLS